MNIVYHGGYEALQFIAIFVLKKAMISERKSVND